MTLTDALTLLVSISGFLSCIPKESGPQLGAESSSSSSGDSGSPQDCGDSQAVPDVYCYTKHSVATVELPTRIVSEHFLGLPSEEFVTYHGRPSPQASLLRWVDGQFQLMGGVAGLSLTDAQQVTATNVSGTTAPDLVWSETWASAAATNEGGKFASFMPIGLPSEAYASPGHTIPFDLAQDGQVEYLKGMDLVLALYEKSDDTWQKSMASFSVPGCSRLWDFVYGDFNNDSLTDLAYIGSDYVDSQDLPCADPSAHGVAVLIQNELGQLQQQPLVSTGQHRFTQIEVGDLDGDGADDLVARATEGDVLAFRSLGSSFAAPVVLEKSLAVVVANTDGDPDDELVIFSTEGWLVKVVDKVLTEPSSVVLPDVIGLPLASGDLNGDGIDDLAFREDSDEQGLVIALSNP